ncbi:MAG: LPXTG cell wall anchor domain-containing protein [Limosilactobacillus sp.]|uniref:LPXTG cell wall anchor domain-containing protein n=1 Tax=Limosilactobacillus sp. TaxID=2773925 RepID=UPI0026F9DA63|nr:LPXTG cell wall anchor domain-containing protein [Limosilactobacillus sp.]
MKSQPNYKLRKLAIGVCSVALMTIFGSHANTAFADDNVAADADATTPVISGQPGPFMPGQPGPYIPGTDTGDSTDDNGSDVGPGWIDMGQNNNVTVAHEGYSFNGQTTCPEDSLNYDKDKVKSVVWQTMDPLNKAQLNESVNMTAVVTFNDGSTWDVTIPVVKMGLALVFQNQIEEQMGKLYYSDDSPLGKIPDDVAKNIIGTVQPLEFAGMTIDPDITEIKGNSNGTITINYADGSTSDVYPEKVKIEARATASKKLVQNVTTDYGEITLSGVKPKSVDGVSGVSNRNAGDQTATVTISLDNGQQMIVPMSYYVEASDVPAPEENNTAAIKDDAVVVKTENSTAVAVTSSANTNSALIMNAQGTEGKPVATWKAESVQEDDAKKGCALLPKTGVAYATGAVVIGSVMAMLGLGLASKKRNN